MNIQPADRRWLKVVHLVFAHEGTEAGNFYNHRSVDWLKRRLSADSGMLMNLPFQQSVEDISRSIVYSHLYTPTERKEVIPVAFNPEEYVTKNGLVKVICMKLEEMFELFSDLFKLALDAVKKIFEGIFGDPARGKKEVDPFKVVIVPDEQSPNTSLLKFAHAPVGIHYADLDSRFYVDKYFQPKVDILRGPMCDLYVIDLPGVPLSSINLSCTFAKDSFLLYGMRSVPSLYADTIKASEDIVLNKRRFSTFSLRFELERGYVCTVEDPAHSVFVDGVLYIYTAKTKNALGYPHPCPAFPVKTCNL